VFIFSISFIFKKIIDWILDLIDGLL